MMFMFCGFNSHTVAFSYINPKYVNKLKSFELK